MKNFIARDTLTSNLKRAADPPKMEDAKCSHRRMERPDESKPPK